MNILMTGANGYLGKETVRFILENTRHRIIGISRHWDKDTPQNARFQQLTCDLLSPLPAGQINRIDVIIHLAALVKINMDSPREVRELLNHNTAMMLNVLNWAKDRHVKRFIFASSMTVYKNAPPKGRLSGQTPLEPPHFYGLSKLWAEQMLHLFCRSKKIHGGLVVRFPGLFGGSRHGGMLYNSVQNFKANKDFKLDLKNLGNWDVLHVRDAAQMLVDLLDKCPLKGNFTVLNAGYGDRMDLNDLLKQMRTYYHSTSKVTILNEQDHCPCSMGIGRLRKLLGSWSFSRKKGLGRLLEEMY